MNIKEADKALGEIFHLVNDNTVITKDLDEAFSMIHYALEKIEAEKNPYHCETCDLKADCPEKSDADQLGKLLLSEIIHYLSHDLACKLSPTTYCDEHVDCEDCDIAKAQSITFKRIEKEFAEWSRNGI